MSTRPVSSLPMLFRALRTCLTVCVIAAAGCAAAKPVETTTAPELSRSDPDPTQPPTEATDPSGWLLDAETALAADQPARAAALFARYLGHDPAGERARQAYPGLARAHEQLGDFEAAIRAYDGFLRHFGTDPTAPAMFGRRGACEAEIGDWETSAASFAAMIETGGEQLRAADRVEALARQGFALFQLDRFDDADARLAQADAIYEAATAAESERFGDTYFVAMARFYRAAILHRQFRDVAIHAGEAKMNADFLAKLELLDRAQAAYNRTIQARHVYWVSAAGFQLGSLFEEFYDAVMYAPVPEWLDEHQRQIYYGTLEEQLRPVVDKAIWVFERNLETARRLGYDNEFVEASQQQLDRVQSLLLGRDGRLGQPMPRLASDPTADPESVWADETEVPAIERKLFVPLPTPL